MSKIESLHTHTTLSDGKLTHREMFDLAESLDISVIAFTDHDSVPSPNTMTELEGLRDRKTKWIIGTELTAGLPEELSPSVGSMHIIGLFIDPTNEALLEHCRLAQEDRIKRMQKIVEGLQNLGFNLTAENCLEASGGDSVGRPHIVEALKKYPENNIVMEKIRREMGATAENDTATQERYTTMMQKGEKSYPYDLLLTPDAFRKCYVELGYLPDLDQAVALIRNAGGVAILAHYFSIRSKMSLEILEKILSEKRLDGVEVVYGLREYGTAREKDIENERKVLRGFVDQYGVIGAGGSDAHSKEDLENYVAQNWFSAETSGFTERILNTHKVDKKFSSLE